MKAFRHAVLFAVISVIVLISLSSMAAGLADQYNDAIAMVNKGEYQTALEKFSEIPAYEQAGKYAMYCKANLMAADGMYVPAIASLQTLEDFLDCKMLTAYFSAREFEVKGETQQAYDIYASIAAFRDSYDQMLKLNPSSNAQNQAQASVAENITPQVILEDNYQEENREGAYIGQVVVNKGQSSHIRNGDSAEYKSIAIGRDGERLDCIGLMLSGWYRVLLPNERIGYISYKYTKLDTAAHKGPKVNNPLTIMSTRSSSERPRSKYTDGAGNYYHYYAANMLDGDLTTAWTPGTGTPSGGDGSGEYADFFFESPVSLEGIQLLNGYQRNKEAFYENNRPKRIEVSFQYSGQGSFESPIEFALYDNLVGWQHMIFTPAKNVSAFRLKVLEVYTGSKFDYDTGITEVRASGQE